VRIDREGEREWRGDWRVREWTERVERESGEREWREKERENTSQVGTR
jgi:hypothetical protein